MVHDGDQNHTGGDVGEACVNVVIPAGPQPDANISISPATATNPVGTNHVLTGHVNVKPQFSFVNAPDGTQITFSIVSGPGSFVGGVNTCTTSGGSGSCTVSITSPTAGTTVVKAATDVTVNGVPIHRETGDQIGLDSDNASKTWRGASVVTTVLDANGTRSPPCLRARPCRTR